MIEIVFGESACGSLPKLTARESIEEVLFQYL
jgi:hypothetical protein